jgi:hypothetical protein
MRAIPDQLKSKNLVPFKKRHGRYKIPGMRSENEVLMDRVDADLSSEEQTYVRHYLGYADALIRGAEKDASPDLSEADLPESERSSEEDLPHKPPAERPTLRLVEEPNHAPALPAARVA